ncbi:hypothetical protein QNI19_12090 [Cytophagaceae bacterium DM2B3-1]|uniref:DUF5020 domain-containing protein n=1 Tax=Xanthocytophaga flava TaxID=3048013 RepID=A0ABT7CIX1_9BACT|nr:hypothetical protein [Xanthocytophaga flavus]MDJ1493673.1 hypothetical protein [Xanthocytophaga flavus]
MRYIRTLLIVCICFINWKCFAQSPRNFQRLASPKASLGPAAAAGPVNPWLTAGITTGYSLNGGDFADNFQASGRALLDVLGPEHPDFSIFIMGNLARLNTLDKADAESKIKEIQQSMQGINFGAYPFFLFNKSDADDVTFTTIYLPLTYKLNALKKDVDSEKIYLNQFRATLGFEQSFLKSKKSGLPITFSLEPTMTFFLDKNDYFKIFGKEKSSLFSLQADLIIPAGTGLGFIASYSTSSENTSQVTFGVIIIGGAK